MNGNPNARFFFTHANGNFFDRNLDLFYDIFNEVWAIYTEDFSQMPDGHDFFIMIPDSDGDGVPNHNDLCLRGDDAIDRDHNGTPDYCSDDCDLAEDDKTIFEDHLSGEKLTYLAVLSITSDKIINTTANITFAAKALRQVIYPSAQRRT